MYRQYFPVLQTLNLNNENLKKRRNQSFIGLIPEVKLLKGEKINWLKIFLVLKEFGQRNWQFASTQISSPSRNNDELLLSELIISTEIRLYFLSFK